VSKTVLKVEDLSKQYRLGEVGTGTLSHDLNRWWYKVRGKEDPYLRIGESNDRTKQGDSDYVWALEDINFEVKQGEILGIIGKNGAGKSTLLKILSKVTGPTTGTIKVKGRIASLLEVGTGFHPEMTGRENIYMNGTIMGMTRAEIKRKLDEIVEFAGVAKYLDTPVKRYSSGMTVRLGFSIAAHLESDILIVDEVLAVGDYQFREKALGKMKNISQHNERTVIFVSHNMASIELLCPNTIVLKKGEISFSGKTSEAIHHYLNEEGVSHLKKGEMHWTLENALGGKGFSLLGLSLKDMKGISRFQYFSWESIVLELTYFLSQKISKLKLVLQIVNDDNNILFTSNIKMLPPLNNLIGKFIVKTTLPEKLLNKGLYKIKVRAGSYEKGELLSLTTLLEFKIDTERVREGLIIPDLKWEISKINT